MRRGLFRFFVSEGGRGSLRGNSGNNRIRGLFGFCSCPCLSVCPRACYSFAAFAERFVVVVVGDFSVALSGAFQSFGGEFEQGRSRGGRDVHRRGGGGCFVSVAHEYGDVVHDGRGGGGRDDGSRRVGGIGCGNRIRVGPVLSHEFSEFPGDVDLGSGCFLARFEGGRLDVALGGVFQVNHDSLLVRPRQPENTKPVPVRRALPVAFEPDIEYGVLLAGVEPVDG